MKGRLIFRIGTSLEEIDREIAERVRTAMLAANRGEDVEASRTVGFESWPTFFRSMTANRIAILEYVSAHDTVPSTRALAKALNRDYAAVHGDVAELVKLGLLERDGNALVCEIDPTAAILAA